MTILEQQIFGLNKIYIKAAYYSFVGEHLLHFWYIKYPVCHEFNRRRWSPIFKPVAFKFPFRISKGEYQKDYRIFRPQKPLYHCLTPPRLSPSIWSANTVNITLYVWPKQIGEYCLANVREFS